MKNYEIQTYRGILKENKGFRNLFYAYSISSLGDWFYSVALISLIYQVTNSSLIISLFFLSSAIPRLILSPIAGVFVDRLDKKKIMVITDIIRAVLIFLVIPLAENLPVIFIITILNSIAGLFFAPARQSLMPSTVRKEQLTMANSMSSMINGLMSILGASVGGAISVIFSYKIAFFINGMSFIIAAFIVSITALPVLKYKKGNTSHKDSYIKSILEGYKFILNSKIIFALIITGLSWGFVGGAFQILIVVYGSKVFEAGNLGISILYSTQGLGTLLGSLLVVRYFQSNMNSMKKVYGWAYLVQGAFFVFFILSNQLYIGIVFLLVMRMAGGIITPLSTTLIQSYTPSYMLGRVFTFHTAVYSGLMQISTFATGLLLEWTSPKIVGLIFGVLCIIASFYWLILFYRNELKVSVREESIMKQG